MAEPTTIVPRRLSVTGAGLTHRGRMRDCNEDAILTDPQGILWAVADGMGGHGHGDLASELVVDTLAAIADGVIGAQEIEAALARANTALRAEALRRGLNVIGSTVVCIACGIRRADVIWAGDSRCYHFHGGVLQRATRDHSIAEEQGAGFQPGVITRAVGATDAFEAERGAIELSSGDRLLLCSDGLTCVVSDLEIAEVLCRNLDPDTMSRALVAAALEAGGPDNISVIVLHIGSTVGPTHGPPA